MSCLLMQWFTDWLHHHVYRVRHDRKYNLCFNELYEYIYEYAEENKYGLWLNELYEWRKYA